MAGGEEHGGERPLPCLAHEVHGVWELLREQRGAACACRGSVWAEVVVGDPSVATEGWAVTEAPAPDWALLMLAWMWARLCVPEAARPSPETCC